MPDEERELLRKLIKQYNLKDTNDIKEMLKDLFGNTIQEMLEAELEEDLGYSKYDYKNKATPNSRNGHSPKRATTDVGEVELLVPRDRAGSFEPKTVHVIYTENVTVPMYQRHEVGQCGSGWRDMAFVLSGAGVSVVGTWLVEDVLSRG